MYRDNQPNQHQFNHKNREQRRSQQETQMQSTTNIAENPLESRKVWLLWVMHVKVDLLNIICNIWRVKSSTIKLQQDCENPKHQQREPHQMQPPQDSHTCTIKNFERILSLGDMQPIIATLNLHTQEVCSSPISFIDCQRAEIKLSGG